MHVPNVGTRIPNPRCWHARPSVTGTRGSSAQMACLAAAGNRAEVRGGPVTGIARGGTGRVRGTRAASHRVPVDQVRGTP